MTAIKQQNNYYCGPATACMVAATLGLGSYTQSEMAKILGTTKKGSSSDQVAAGLNSLLENSTLSGRYKKTSTDYSNLSNSIVYSVNGGFPVVINVKVMPQYTVSVGHFIAANGYCSGFSGSTSISDVKICDPHPDYYGAYTYSMDTIVNACTSAVGNFCRLA